MDDVKYQKLISLADELVSQVRAEALVSLRFLDVALYKLKFKYDFNTTLFTDGEFLYMNPNHIFGLYKAEYNMLLMHNGDGLYYCNNSDALANGRLFVCFLLCDSIIIYWKIVIFCINPIDFLSNIA
jgi:hypothetical protein